MAATPIYRNWFVVALWLIMVSKLDAQSIQTGGTSLPIQVTNVRSLIDAADRWQKATDIWNTWSVGMLLGTAAVAVGTFIVQYRAITAAKKLAAVQSELLKAKDEQLQKDLKNKDIEIAQLNTAAASLNSDSIAKELQIARLNSDAAAFKTDASHALQSAADANERAKLLETDIATLHLQAERLSQQNLLTSTKLTDANASLEQERAKRLELEKSLAPRIVRETGYPNGTENTDALKKFAGIEYFLEVIPDAESIAASIYLRSVLDQSGWKFHQPHTILSLTIQNMDRKGVEIERYFSREQRDVRAFLSRPDSRDAAESLESFLESNNWEVIARDTETDVPGRENLNPDQVRIVVGFKTFPYFDPDFLKILKQQIQQSKDISRKQIEDIQKNLPHH